MHVFVVLATRHASWGPCQTLKREQASHQLHIACLLYLDLVKSPVTYEHLSREITPILELHVCFYMIMHNPQQH